MEMKMRFTEIANAEDQLALWRLISDNVWSVVLAQTREQERQKAQAASRPKKAKPRKTAPKPPAPPKPKVQAPKPPPISSPVPRQAQAVPPTRSVPLPSSQPVLRPTHSSSFSQADLQGLQQAHMGSVQSAQAPNSRF